MEVFFFRLLTSNFIRGFQNGFFLALKNFKGKKAGKTNPELIAKAQYMI